MKKQKKEKTLEQRQWHKVVVVVIVASMVGIAGVSDAQEDDGSNVKDDAREVEVIQAQ